MDDSRFFSPKLFLALTLVLVCFSYANTLYSPLVLDDQSAFIDPELLHLKDLSAQSILNLTNNPFGWRRLIPILSFSLDHFFSNGNIVQYHRTNILIHLGCTLSLFFLILSLLTTPIGRRNISSLSPCLFAVFTCSLWALHPIQTNAVTYLVQRMAAIAALFYFTSLTCYIQARRQTVTFKKLLLFLLALLAMLGAFLSKPNTATLPVLIIAVEFIFISPQLAGRISNRLTCYHWLLLLIIIILLLPFLESYIRSSVLPGYQTRNFTLSERILTQFRVVVFYLSLLLLPLPSRLNLDHDFSISHSWLSPPTTLTSFMFLLTLIVFAFRLRKTHLLVTFGLFWFFLNLAIESSIIPLEIIFEHRLYLPSAGFFLIIVAGIDWLAGKVAAKRNDCDKVILLGMTIALSVLSLLTTLRNHDWRDQYSIYLDAAQKSPKKPRPQVNLGLALIGLKKYDEAIQALEHAITLGQGKGDEEFITSANNILACYTYQENYPEVIVQGEKFIKRISPEMNFLFFDRFLANLGRANLMEQEYGKSFKALKYGLMMFPNENHLQQQMEQLLIIANKNEKGRIELDLNGTEISVLLKMVEVMLAAKNYAKASSYMQQANFLEPDAEQVNQLQERYRQELRLNQTAISTSDISKDRTHQRDRRFRLYLSLANFLSQYYAPLDGWPVKTLLRAAETRSPGNPFIELYLTQWDIRHDQPISAEERLKNILKKYPDFVPGLTQAGTFFLAQNKEKEAAAVFEHLLKIYPGHPQWQNFNDFLTSYRFKTREGGQSDAR